MDLITARNQANKSPALPGLGTFGSLRSRNFRLMAASNLLAGTGFWMGYAALNWLVLSLTGNAADVGLTGALLSLPVLVLGMTGGVLADRYPKRRTLLFFYGGLASLSALLGGLTLAHIAQLWHVQLTAAGLGVVYALGRPAQQSFIAELVKPVQLRNAISITALMTQLGVLVGPAAGGLLISAVGPGGSFLVAAVCYMLPLVAVTSMRNEELHALPPVPDERGWVRAGLRYAVSRPDVLWPTILVALFAMFTNNLSVTLAVYAKSVYDSGPGGYGLLSAMLAVGSLAGALFSTRLQRVRLRTLVLFGVVLSALYIISAGAPTQLVFCALLVCIGANTLLLQTSAISTVQLAAHDRMRGRIVSIYFFTYSTCIAVGGPLLGNIDQHFGPQAGMLLAGALPGIATLLIAAKLAINLRRSLRQTVRGG